MDRVAGRAEVLASAEWWSVGSQAGTVREAKESNLQDAWVTRVTWLLA